MQYLTNNDLKVTAQHMSTFYDYLKAEGFNDLAATDLTEAAFKEYFSK